MMAFLMPLMILVINITTLAIVWFGAIRIDSGHMAIGDVLAFTQYLMLIMFAVMMFAMMFIMLPRASASAIRINEILETMPEIQDPAKANHQDEVKGFLEFKNVTFTYHGAEQPALIDISFTAKPGEVTAIIGGTGSGKSTLINLIPRFYDVDSGQVLLNNVDVKQIKQSELRSKLGIVPQKNVLFSGKITDNIRFGKETATLEDIHHAAECAMAGDFIEAMADGYESAIAQGGTNVSGGQKQRIAIARALVKKPEFYIFDDSFSALDFKTERKLRTALKSEIKEAAVMIVAQRVTTVIDADRILVLDEGRLVGNGTHRELLETCKVYREIVASQLSEEELA
jgi:ATP-binding cassette subfamily B protein